MSLVNQTRAMAHELMKLEVQGRGDIPDAMQRLAERHDIPMTTLYSLRYRPPQRILADVYIKITNALQAERERQLGKLQDDINRTRTAAGNRSPSLAAIETLVRATNLESPAHDRPIRTPNQGPRRDPAGF